MTDKTTQEPVLYQRWYQGVWFKVNPGDVEKLESDGWSIRRLYADQPAPVAVVLPEREHDKAYRNGLMQGYNLALNGSEQEYQDAVARYSKNEE